MGMEGRMRWMEKKRKKESKEGGEREIEGKVEEGNKMKKMRKREIR